MKKEKSELEQLLDKDIGQLAFENFKLRDRVCKLVHENDILYRTNRRLTRTAILIAIMLVIALVAYSIKLD